MNLGLYAKSVQSTLVALVGTLVIVYADGNLSLEDWLTLVLNTAVAGVAVTLVKNTANFRAAKTVVSVIVTLIGSVLASVQAGSDVSTTVLLTAVLAVLNGFGTYQVPEASVSGNVQPDSVDYV